MSLLEAEVGIEPPGALLLKYRDHSRDPVE